MRLYCHSPAQRLQQVGRQHKLAAMKSNLFIRKYKPNKVMWDKETKQNCRHACQSQNESERVMGVFMKMSTPGPGVAHSADDPPAGMKSLKNKTENLTETSRNRDT